MGDIFHVWYRFEDEAAFLPSMWVSRKEDESAAIAETHWHANRRRPGVAITISKIEQWRRLPAPLEKVEVSSLGNIRHTYKNICRNLNPSVNSEGYLTVSLFLGGKFVTHTVHRLIALAFLGEPSEGQDHVDHLDSDRTNNRVDNLEWVSVAENNRRAAARRRARVTSESGEGDQA